MSIVFTLITSAAMANVYLDLSFGMLDGGDAGKQRGAALGMALTLHNEYLLKYRGSYTLLDDKGSVNTGLDDKSNSHMIQTFGLEYLFPVSDYRLMLRPSLMLGICKTDIEIGGKHKSDTGLSMGFFLGLDFHATQYISPFIELGYHYSSYQIFYKLDDYDISGITANIGVRFAFGGNRDIYQDY